LAADIFGGRSRNPAVDDRLNSRLRTVSAWRNGADKTCDIEAECATDVSELHDIESAFAGLILGDKLLSLAQSFRELDLTNSSSSTRRGTGLDQPLVARVVNTPRH
jgi:hypothetical protein